MTGEGQHIDASIHEACALTTESAVPTYIYLGQVVQRHTGRHAAPGPSTPTQIPTSDGAFVQTTGRGGNPNPTRLRGLAEWMDGYGLAGDLLDDKYLDWAVFRDSEGHIAQVVNEFISSMPQDQVWRGGQDRGYPWGAVRTLDDIMGDSHLQDRDFFKRVEHPELGAAFIYPGPAGIFNGSPWRISRRAPLIGEHNGEVYCGDLGMSRERLNVLAEAGVI